MQPVFEPTSEPVPTPESEIEPSAAPIDVDQAQGVLVVTGPRQGFRRGGMAFGATPVAIDLAEFAWNDGADRKLLAILTEQRLTCVVRMPDGSEHAVSPAAVEQLLAALAEDDA